ncbi:MAG: DNA polymerase III subunit beta [Clostridia bacterium]|nr:DNA polymerase III subunit beta [Clostridia bacterium]
MKLVCEGLDLADSVLKVVKACSSKNIMPVLECIKLSARNDMLTLSATDGEIAIIKNVKAEVMEEGEVCVQGRYFSEFVRKVESFQILLETDGISMNIMYAQNKTCMQILSADDFPVINTDINESCFSLPTNNLKKYINFTTFCCATDESRPILKGCQFVIKGSELSVTSLDGFRLATISGTVASSTGNMEIVCPARTLNEIDKMLPASDDLIDVYVQHGMMLVASEDTILTSRLYSGDFIRKENIIPRNFNTTVKVNRLNLKSSIERAAVFVKGEKNSLIVFDISGNQVMVSTNSEIARVNEPLEAEVTGKDLRIAMNSRFIIDAVNNLEDEEIVMSFNRQIDPFICQNRVDLRSLYLILPVRTANNA